MIVFLVGVGVVISMNPSSKVNPGHDSTEVMVNVKGKDKTLQQAIDDGDFMNNLECIILEKFERGHWKCITNPCPDGYNLTGGGYWQETGYVDSNQDTIASLPRRSDNRGWEVKVKKHTKIRCYAICCRVV